MIENLILNITIFPVKKIKGILFSADIYLNIDFSLDLYKNDKKDIDLKLNNFSLFLIILSSNHFFSILSVINDYLYGKINLKSISPYFIIFNIIWNVDSSFIDIYFGIYYSNKKGSLFVPFIINCLNYILIESKLLYLSIKLQDEFEDIRSELEINNELNSNINIIIEKLLNKKFLKIFLFQIYFIFISLFFYILFLLKTFYFLYLLFQYLFLKYIIILKFKLKIILFQII